ncbi:MAG: ceramidase [Cytophagaceae bacterium]|jgi:hypothetical protein|nr:ceramidase [Cytophagaceae bacterium]
MRNEWKLWIFLACSLMSLLVLAFLPPISQDPHYHCFAGDNTIFGIPCAANVVSNLGFILVGVVGFLHSSKLVDARRPMLMFFWFAMILTGLGSAYYHWSPNHARLVWDRIPMSLAFMTLLTLAINEHVHSRLAKRIWIPLLAAGVISVVHWYLSEKAGKGDLRWYAWVQFYPMLAIPILLIMYQRAGAWKSIWLPILLCYALAKGLELADHTLWNWGIGLSGHPLKHLLAAAAVVPVVQWTKVYASASSKLVQEINET